MQTFNQIRLDCLASLSRSRARRYLEHKQREAARAMFWTLALAVPLAVTCLVLAFASH